MARRHPGSQPTWTDVKAKLASFDRLRLLGLIQDLYVAHKDNQTFLHARLGLGEDVLKPYKETLDRWLWPDVLRNQNTSVAKAKQAISNYRKAVGEPVGLAKLMVFYCERAVGFCNDIGYQDEGYFDALVRMFEQALRLTDQLPATERTALTNRPAESRTRHQQQLRLWRRRRHGLNACEIRQRLTIHLLNYAALPELHGCSSDVILR
jgi:hypothetical protein